MKLSALFSVLHLPRRRGALLNERNAEILPRWSGGDSDVTDLHRDRKGIPRNIMVSSISQTLEFSLSVWRRTRSGPTLYQEKGETLSCCLTDGARGVLSSLAVAVCQDYKTLCAALTDLHTTPRGRRFKANRIESGRQLGGTVSKQVLERVTEVGQAGVSQMICSRQP